MKNRLKVNLISLGCPKNLIDSEVILGKLGEKGLILTSSCKIADVIIINTCSFIKEAREESYQVISRVIREKSPDQKLIVCGCLPQLERRKLFYKFPQINALLGSADFYRIEEVINILFALTRNGKQRRRLFYVSQPRFIYNSKIPRLVSTPPGYAYLKIAEGCSNRCSFCLIPSLRGEFRSRKMQDIIKEARDLATMGVKELILVAQDTTYYGQERKGSASLTSLLKKLEEVEKIRWIRVLYFHPLHFDFHLIKLMQRSFKICPYVEIPLQHTHNDILRAMRRPSFEKAQRIIDQLREQIPHITLRSSLMVGFPGEKNYHFEKLLKDVERLQFDWLGVFTYSREKNTPAYSLPQQVPEKIKQKRREELLLLQQSITLKKNRERVGKTYPVLVDFNPDTESAEGEGHTPFQTPEIDGKIFFSGGRYSPGEIFQGKVVSVKDSFDLYVDLKQG